MLASTVRKLLTPLLLVLTLGSIAPAEASAQQSISHGAGDFGLGLILGDPTGINGKYFLSREMAIDGSIGLGFIGGHYVQLNMDFLWHFGIQNWSAAGLDLYVGVGPALAFHDHDNGRWRRDFNDDFILIGPRAPFGASLTFNKAPFDIFLEIAATLWIVEATDFDIDAALGFRFWF